MQQDHIEPESLMDVRLLDAQGHEQAFVPDDASIHLIKIPIRAEYRALLQAAEAYEMHARLVDEEAERLRTLARQAREQGENLRQVANL